VASCYPLSTTHTADILPCSLLVPSPHRRLDSVIRSDQVIVMDAGQVAEIAPPSVLLANPNSAFSKLVDRTGASSAAAMRKMAADFADERARGQAIGFKKRPSLDETRRSLDEAGGALHLG